MRSISDPLRRCTVGSLDIRSAHLSRSTTCRHGIAHRKWKENKQQPGTAEPGNRLGCCLVSFHFLWAILCPQAVKPIWLCRILDILSWQAEDCLRKKTSFLAMAAAAGNWLDPSQPTRAICSKQGRGSHMK